MDVQRLVGIQKQESNHEREEAGSFGESESQDSVREELTFSRSQHCITEDSTTLDDSHLA